MSALRLELTPSRGLAAAIGLLHLAAAGAAVAVLPPLPGALLGAALLALGVAAAWGRALLASPASVRMLQLDGPALRIGLKDGRSFAVELAERRYVGAHAVALRLRRPMRLTLFITAKMLDPEAFRALRIWALWGRLRSQQGASFVAGKQLAA